MFQLYHFSFTRYLRRLMIAQKCQVAFGRTSRILEMEGVHYFIGVVTLMILFWHVTHFANAQPGFLSIDCGAHENHTDEETNITWVTDNNFIHVGFPKELYGMDAYDYTDGLDNSTLPFYLESQRVFPKPHNKSCYRLTMITPNLPYLLRLSFVGSDENGAQEFEYSIEAEDMLYLNSLAFYAGYRRQELEHILVTSDKVVYICLIRTAECDDPFISAIELRTLQAGMYAMAKPGTLLQKIQRYDFGGKNETRYPQDGFDRLWSPLVFSRASLDVSSTHNISVISSTHNISVNNTQNRPPINVMQTAVASDWNYDLTFYLGESMTGKSLAILYFAEVNVLEISSFNVRVFDYYNESNFESNFALISLVLNFSAMELEIPFLFNAPIYVCVSLFNGRPIINAAELYDIVPSQPPTSPTDVRALNMIKSGFGLKNWTTDPCFGSPWEGIIVCNQISKTVRVSEINLSGWNVRGSIPPSFGNLTELVSMSLDNNNLNGTLPNLSALSKLEKLHLQNNMLSGTLPDWLSQLKSLKEMSLDNNNLNGNLPNLSALSKLEKLHLQNNKLSGTLPDWLSRLKSLQELFIQNNRFSGGIPKQLLDNKHLQFKYDGNKDLCEKKDCLSSKRLSPGAVLGITGAGIVTTFLVGAMVYRMKFSTRTQASVLNRNYSMVLIPNSSTCRAFTLEEMITATENFGHEIGRGGFGSVFLGNLQEGEKIAVKVLSLFSKHGIAQFLNEVDLLSRINHKKLVSFLGYCNESKDLMLVYEYMSGGSFSDNLYDPQPSKYPHLDWKARLKIALDAAQGLEYLHVGCTPKIIHRDVKTANILLDSDLNGKLADFGLSRVTITGEASQINTTIKGTPGYLDPKYYQTHILTDKSNVYSFGVVLLELICGRRPIDINLSPKQIILTEWVPPYVGLDKDQTAVTEIVDKRLGEHYNLKSMNHVASLACRCVGSEPSSRPSMSEVVVEMKEAITFEEDVDYEVTDEVPLISTGSP